MFHSTKLRAFVLLPLIILSALIAYPQDASDIFGSAKPYPIPNTQISIPDSLIPVIINHTGRHGARFPSGPSHTATIRQFLSSRSLTPLGHRLMHIADSIDHVTDGHWGALDSLGMAEQMGIARRMVERYPAVFSDSVRISAISSYVPRCVSSMYSFLHQVSAMRHNADITAASGPRFSPLMRFFSISAPYRRWADTLPLQHILISLPQFDTAKNSVSRLISGPADISPSELFKFLMAEYSTLAIQSASGGSADTWRQFLTPHEMEALWTINNARQHILHSSSSRSLIPSAIAAPLLLDIVSAFDTYIISGPSRTTSVHLRFGHAETLMPLLALMQTPGCYFTGPTRTVADYWRNYHIVPMAANLQMIMLRSQSNNYYVLTLLNEVPVQFPGLPLYAPWPQLRAYLLDKI